MLKQWHAAEAVKLTLVCMQDISSGILVSENLAVFQEVL